MTVLKQRWQWLLDQRWLMPLLLVSGLILAVAIPRFGLFNNYVQMLLMYIGSRENWPGQYLIGVAFGVVGAAACLVVTLLPTWRRKPAVLAPSDHSSTLEATR